MLLSVPSAYCVKHQLTLLEGLPCTTISSELKAVASMHLNLLKRDGDEVCQGSPLYRHPEVFEMLF